MTVNRQICSADPLLDDIDEIEKLWRDDQARLFSDSGNVRLKVLNAGQQCLAISFRSEENLLNTLEASKSRLRIVLFPQTFSWGSLMVSEKCARLVLSHLQVFPAFLPFLHAFGQQTNSTNESLAGFRAQKILKSEGRERCYLLKCVQKHGRGDLVDPWSVRQFAVYHKHEEQDQKDTFLLVNPSGSPMLRDKIKLFSQTFREDLSSSTLHALFASAATRSWADYLSWLEGELCPLTTKAHVAAPEPRHPQTRVENLQSLQVLQDKLYMIRHVLKMNISTLTALKNDLWPGNEPPSTAHGVEASSAYDRFAMCLFELQTAFDRAEVSLERASAVAALMQNMISTRSLEALDASSRLTAKMTSLAQEDNKLMLDLSTENQRDGRTLKTITILTLVYLPASFVSTLLGMGYITVRQETGGHFELDFKPEMWIFGVLSIICLLVTFGSWLYVDSRRRKAGAAAVEGHARDPEK